MWARPLLATDLYFFMAPLALMWLAFWTLYAPAIMTSDSTDQWHMGHTMQLADYHPVLHTLTMRLLTLAWDSPASVALAQIVLLSACIAYALTLALRAGAPRWAVGLAFLSALCSPRNMTISITLWKDVWYTLAVFCFSILLAHGALSKRFVSKPVYWALAGMLLGLIPLYRHNGLLILLGFIPLFPLGFWPMRWRVAGALVLALALYGGVKYGIYPRLKVVPLQSLAGFGPTRRILPLIHGDYPLTENEYEFLDRIQPFRGGWVYHPTMVCSSWMDQNFNLAFVKDHFVEYQRIDRSLMMRYPLLHLRAYLRTNSFLFWPPQHGNDLINCYALNIYDGNQDGLKTTPLINGPQPLVERLLGYTVHRYFNWFFWRPAIHLWIVLAAMVVLVRRTGRTRLLIAFMPAALNTLSLFLAAPSQDQRYQFPLTIATGFFCCLALLRPSSARVAGPAEDNQEDGRQARPSAAEPAAPRPAEAVPTFAGE